MRFGRLFAVLAFVGLAWSCDSGSSGTSCSVDTDCDQGSICVGGSCSQVECTKHSECPGEEPFCAPEGVVPSQPDKRFCSPVECKSDLECTETGEICNEFKQCVPGTTPDAQTPDGVIDTDVTDVPDTTVNPGDKITSCIPCTKDSDCTDSTCKPLGGSTFCFADCETNDDCPTGWMCYALATTGKQCIPMKFNCDATCLNTPCAAGQVCNQDTGECIEEKTECGGCQQDWECQEGYRCNQVGKYCAPACGEGDACPTNSSCQEVNSMKVNVCVSTCTQCCYGDACECASCPADKPYSKNGICVQCLNDTHCTSGTCSSEGVCQGGTECPADKPYDKNGVCVQCLQDSHCTTINVDFKCVGNVCKDPGDVPPECTYCVDPYPACVQINGIWSCVQCTDDTFCMSPATCDTGLYSCSNGEVPPGGDCGMCTSDSDCTSSQGLTLTCDTVSHCCYDAVGGSCDNVEVKCKDGMDCKSLLDLLGMGTAIPGMPEMETGLAGSCGCPDPTSDIMSLLTCSFMGGCPESGCAAGSVCVDPNAVMGMLGGGTTGTPSETGMCFNLQDLLGGIM